MKRIKVRIYRHAQSNELGDDITPYGTQMAKAAAELEGPFDVAFSAANGRSVATAMALGRLPEKKVNVSRVFDDFQKGDNIASRIAEIQAYLLTHTVDAIGYAADVVNVLVVTSSDLIAAINLFIEGKPIPEDLGNLQVVKHLQGTEMTIHYGC